METWGRLLLLGCLLVLLWHFLRRPWNLRILVHDGNVTVHGPALASKQVAVSEFFRKDLPEVQRARITGYWNGRSLRLRFRGRVSPTHRQRIRNYLLTTL